MNFQAIHGFEVYITLVTLKVSILLLRLLVGFQTSHHRRRGGLFGQKLFLVFGFPFEGRLAFSLFILFWQGCLAYPGVQGEGKGGVMESLKSLPWR